MGDQNQVMSAICLMYMLIHTYNILSLLQLRATPQALSAFYGVYGAYGEEEYTWELFNK
jgi:hypothetical protein